MRARAFVVVLLVASLVASPACSDEAEEAPESPFRRSTAIIETDDGAVLFRVDVADTPELRAQGLMHRESLGEDEGMVFVFFEDTSSAFFMKDTLIPLSIAFFSRDGEIVQILDMEPCEAEPCPLYEPGLQYRGALEVNQGAFERLGIEEGDTIRVSP